MRLFQTGTFFSAACILTASAHAQPTEQLSQATASVSRHFSSNALDLPTSLPDWYTQLRGSVSEIVAHDLGSTRVSGEFNLRKFDTYSHEDDAAGGLSLATTLRPTNSLELRGTLSLGLVSEGDELVAGNAMVGMRTLRTTSAMALQAGMQLSPATVLVLEGSAMHERSGKTRFKGGLLPPTRLDPTRDRGRLSTTLTQTQGSFSYGLYAAAGIVRSAPIGLLPALRTADYAARLHARYASPEGFSLSGSAGIEVLNLLGTSFRQARAAYEFSVETPLATAFSLRGALKAGYDLSTRDDPLAVWVRRFQAEAQYQANAVLRFGAGIFLEGRENIGLETRERLRGIYGEAVWQAFEKVALTFRVDGTRRATVGFDDARRSIDIQLGISTEL